MDDYTDGIIHDADCRASNAAVVWVILAFAVGVLTVVLGVSWHLGLI
jgi:hypothetical protein